MVVTHVNSQIAESSPLSGMMGAGEMKPAGPAATKYAALFALVSGIAGGLLLVRSKA